MEPQAKEGKRDSLKIFSNVRRGLLIADPVHPYLELGSGSSLDHLQAASIQYRIAIGPQAGRKALTLYSLPPTEENLDIPLLADSGD